MSDHQQAVMRFSALPLIATQLSRLQNELADDLYFHNLKHTQDVLEEVLRFALHDALADAEIELLAIAAAYHDAGYLFSRKDNEALGAQIAVEAMKRDGGYSDQACQLVAQMILDTRVITQGERILRNASTPLSGYLLDADVGNLGRKDFWQANVALQRELAIDETAFLAWTVEFLRAHRWCTPAAKEMRGAQFEENLAALEKRLLATV